MFERFTEDSRTVLIEAQGLALKSGARHITVGHLLYGCAQDQETTAGGPLRDAGITVAAIRRLSPGGEDKPANQTDPEALSAIGIDYQGVREAVEETFGTGALEAAPDRRDQTSIRSLPLTSETKRSLKLALQVAKELHHDPIVPGHLLLGLLRLDDEFISRIITQSETTIAVFSATVLARVSVI